MRIDSCEHLHKSRLARPVLSNQGVNFALMKIEGHSVECTNTREGFRNIAHLEEGCLIRGRHLAVWMVFGLWSHVRLRFWTLVRWNVGADFFQSLVSIFDHCA